MLVLLPFLHIVFRTSLSVPRPLPLPLGLWGTDSFFLAYVDNIKQLQPRLWNPVLVFHGFPPPPRPRPLDVKNGVRPTCKNPTRQIDTMKMYLYIYNIHIHVHVHVHIHIHICIYINIYFYIIIK